MEQRRGPTFPWARVACTPTGFDYDHESPGHCGHLLAHGRGSPMPRTIDITTLWTAAWEESNVNRSCPGEHQLPDRPELRHVITKVIDARIAAAYLAEHGI